MMSSSEKRGFRPGRKPKMQHHHIWPRRRFRREQPGPDFWLPVTILPGTGTSKMSNLPFRPGLTVETKLGGTISHQRETTSPKTAHDIGWLAGKSTTTHSLIVASSFDTPKACPVEAGRRTRAIRRSCRTDRYQVPSTTERLSNQN
jgi:hypothetical protein